MMKAHGNEENDGIDRISSLPDEVCTHILSFVSTREAVQTCILSKRWINTWASVPDLKFDIKELAWQRITDDHEIALESLTKFELLLRSVLESVLEKRDTSCVNRFQLCADLDCGFPCTEAIVDCIGDVIKLGSRVCLLKMCACFVGNYNLSMDVIFSCASLIYLQLQMCQFSSEEIYNSFPIEPNSVNLPCLKTLNLDSVQLSDDSLKKLLLGCPVLEELVLEACCLDITEIYSNTLKKLVLSSLSTDVRLQISTPNLVYLNIDLWDLKEIMLLNMPSLVVTMELIHSLSNVECLQLEFNYPALANDGKVLTKDFSDFPIFKNLECLKLLNWHFYGFGLAPYFLHHSPELQELTLAQSRPSYSTRYSDEEITQEEWGDVLVQREFLETVRIVGFKNDTGFVDKLINKLLVHVKTIGEIDIV